MEEIWYSTGLTLQSVEASNCSYFQVPWEIPKIETPEILDWIELLEKLRWIVSPCGCQLLNSDEMSAVHKGEKLGGFVLPFYGDVNYIWAFWFQPEIQNQSNPALCPVLVGRIINSSFFEVKGLASKSFPEFVKRKEIEAKIFYYRFIFAGTTELSETEREYGHQCEEAEKQYFSENDEFIKVEKLYNCFIKHRMEIRTLFLLTEFLKSDLNEEKVEED